MVIRLNEHVQYRVRRDRMGDEVRIELPRMSMADRVVENFSGEFVWRESNELLRDLWVLPCESSGGLVVGLRLESSGVLVSSPRLQAGENWEIVIEFKRRSLRDVPLPANVPEGSRVG